MSHLDQQPYRTPTSFWVALALCAAVIGSVLTLMCAPLEGAEPAPRVDVALLGWKLFVMDHDGASYQRGADLFGGRAVASMDLKAGLHLGLRGDASALSAEFDPVSPSTYGTVRTLEGYGALSRPFAFGAWTAGPAVMVGALVPVSTETSWASKPTAGGGLRIGFGRSWAYVLAGPNGAADERAPGTSPVRLLVAGQIEWKRFALVGDFVSGPGGFARGGVAYRVPIPFGATP